MAELFPGLEALAISCFVWPLSLGCVQNRRAGRVVVRTREPRVALLVLFTLNSQEGDTPMPPSQSSVGLG